MIRTQECVNCKGPLWDVFTGLGISRVCAHPEVCDCIKRTQLRHCVRRNMEKMKNRLFFLQATIMLSLSNSSPSAPSSLSQCIKAWEKWYLTLKFIINSSVFYCRNISHNELFLHWCRFGVSLSLEVLHNLALINGDLLQIALQSW